jgi:hypothetical protein
VSDETRRASAAFAFLDAGGSVTVRGQDEAVIDDDGLTVGAMTLAFLDADSLRAEDYEIAIGCWPGGTLLLTQLGRRFDTFTAELRRARNQARVVGLLAHGITRPESYPAAVLGESSARPVSCLVYDTHVTLVPEDGDPWQIPLGSLDALELIEEPPAAVLRTTTARTVIGLLARRRDEFHRVVTERRQAQATLLRQVTGLTVFADGMGVRQTRLPRFETVVSRWTPPGRASGVELLLGAAWGDEPRLGFVQLLDPERDGEGVPDLPEGWATFLLVPVGPLTVLEILAGPAAATYVFASPIEDVNRDLQLLHFRRAALSLSGEDVEPAAGNSYRLALRRLEPLRRLRAATRARIVHNDAWANGLAQALAS